jgi:hypothetical protein
MAKRKKTSLHTKSPKQSADIVAPHVAVKGEPGVFVRIVDGAVVAPVELEVEIPVNENRPADGVVKVSARTRRVKAPIDVALGYGRITAEQHEAGARLYECFAFGVIGASGGPTKGHTAAKAVGGNGVSDARVQAITHYRKAMLWIKEPIVRQVLQSVVCYQNTVMTAAKDLGLTPAMGTSYLRSGLDTVAEYFDVG